MTRKNFALRINAELYAALARWAADDLRSVNAQIEYLLTQSVRAAGRAPEPASAVVGSEPPTDQGKALDIEG